MNTTCVLEDKGNLINNCYYIILDNTANYDEYYGIDLTGGTVPENEKLQNEIDKLNIDIEYLKTLNETITDEKQIKLNNGMIKKKKKIIEEYKKKISNATIKNDSGVATGNDNVVADVPENAGSENAGSEATIENAGSENAGSEATIENAGSEATIENAGSEASNENAGSEATIENAGSGATIENAGSGATIENAGSGASNENAGSGASNENAGSEATIENAGSGASNENAGSEATIENAGSGASNENAGSEVNTGSQVDVPMANTSGSNNENLFYRGLDYLNRTRNNIENRENIQLTLFSNIEKYIRKADKQSLKNHNPKSKLSLFVFKLNVDGNFSNVEVLHKLCDTNDQIISGYFFEYTDDYQLPEKLKLKQKQKQDEFFRKLDKIKSTKEEDSRVKSNIDLIYEGLNDNVISCKKAQLEIKVDEVYNNINEPSLTFKDGSYYDNLKIINRHVDVRVEDYELFSENSKLFKAILDYLRNDEITALNFSDKIFPFNKYIEDISTLKVKSILFTSPEQQSHRGGSTQGKYTKRRKNTKRRRTRNKNKRYM